MSTDGTYNGWKNYETWAVKLWIDNEEPIQDFWLEAAREASKLDGPVTVLERQLECYYEDDNFPAVGNNVYSDLLAASLRSVDWQEIAASLIDDAKELEEHSS